MEGQEGEANLGKQVGVGGLEVRWEVILMILGGLWSLRCLIELLYRFITLIGGLERDFSDKTEMLW